MKLFRATRSGKMRKRLSNILEHNRQIIGDGVTVNFFFNIFLFGYFSASDHVGVSVYRVLRNTALHVALRYAIISMDTTGYSGIPELM